MNKITFHSRTLKKSLPSIPVYCYLLLLAIASTSAFICLLIIVP